MREGAGEHPRYANLADAGAVEAAANVATSWARSDQLRKNALHGDQTAGAFPFGEAMSTSNSALIIEKRRKTPSFSYGNIRRVRRICVSY